MLDLHDMPALECYPGKMNQVFMNMLNNALQAVKARHGNIGGHVWIASRMENDQVTISIRDNGPGMSEEVRRRVFEPFFTTKAVGEGTGMGLAISREIIEQKHGGTMDFESEPGRGTTFHIRIPVRQTRSVGL